MPESNEDTGSSSVRAPITKMVRDLIILNFEKELKAAKCHHGGNLCPNHVMRIFKKVFNKYTLVIDDDDLGVSPSQPSDNPKS